MLAPWAVNATSAYGPQASFSLYYGIPLLAFATVAAAEALRGEAGRRLVHSGTGPVLAAALVVLNVAEFRVPAIPRERSAVLEAIGRIPSGTRVQAMACFFPVLGYERAKTLVDVPPRLDGDWVVLRTHSTTWPLSPVEATAALRAALASGDYRVAANVGGTWLLERQRRSP